MGLYYSSTNWPVIILIISWIILSCTLAMIGDKRKIGAGGAILCSLFFSPVVGLIVVAFSNDLEEAKREEEIYFNIKKQTEIMIGLRKKFLPEMEEEKKPEVDPLELEKKVQEKTERLRSVFNPFIEFNK